MDEIFIRMVPAQDSQGNPEFGIKAKFYVTRISNEEESLFWEHLWMWPFLAFLACFFPPLYYEKPIKWYYGCKLNLSSSGLHPTSTQTTWYLQPSNPPSPTAVVCLYIRGVTPGGKNGKDPQAWKEATYWVQRGGKTAARRRSGWNSLVEKAVPYCCCCCFNFSLPYCCHLFVLLKQEPWLCVTGPLSELSLEWAWSEDQTPFWGTMVIFLPEMNSSWNVAEGGKERREKREIPSRMRPAHFLSFFFFFF